MRALISAIVFMCCCLVANGQQASQPKPSPVNNEAKVSGSQGVWPFQLNSNHRLWPIEATSSAAEPPPSCPNKRNESPVKCDCTDSQGHHFTRYAACFSCWTTVNPQKCNTQCYACVPTCAGTPPQPMTCQ